ncbi:TonB-dependent receptor [Sphingomonas sp. URHD0057]|uniref:TonB-dependent receptor n=1 Tax=Sphingomonas sp. URHD0057 TaxID=1380389 RepID=UPI000684ED0B|nr:TonB-dependent receptor [Sphingomonas sp. URHD0057]
MDRTAFLATAAVIVPFSPVIAQSNPANVPVVSDTATTAQAEPRADVPPASPNAAPPAASNNIVVTGRRLDIARDSITPSLGASQYTFDREALEKQPGGTNLTLNKSLLQAPGVVQDSYGVIHVRNEHANLQYRLNGVIVPESISGFGTTFDPRIASSIQLITGTLPAQYGYRTAGVVNFKTQSGLLENGGEVGIYGGSFGWLEPSAMIEGSSGNLSYFASASYLRNDLGIENPLPTRRAIHDRTTQFRPFAYVSDILSDSSRIAVFGGSFIGHFQIPNVTGVGGDFTVNGVSSADAAKLDQNQREITHYGVAAYQYAGNTLNFQIAPFVRYSQTRFTPDPNFGDIIFTGFADAARLSSLATGIQADASQQLGSNHTLRFGVFFQNEHTTSNVVSSVLPIDEFGDQTSDVLINIVDRGKKTGQLYGAYLQDEWKLTPTLTLNYGARYDIVHAFTHERQLSPRANLVWRATPLTTLHVGYARTFTPPPQELIAPATVALYNGTTKESEIKTGDPVKSEREHYFDAGVEQRFNGGFKLGLDAYYKIKRNLLDEGQFGAAVVLSPFNYAKGYAWGVELSSNYTHGPIDLYANVARGQEKAKDINSAQYFFAPDELAYIQNHYIYTDHSQKWTASGGGSYTIRNRLGTLVPTADFIFASGLRTDDPAGIVPNGGELPSYFVLNAGLSQNFSGPGILKGVTIRADVLNLFDKVYQIRSGEGVGVGAPQWGERRGAFAGISKKF